MMIEPGAVPARNTAASQRAFEQARRYLPGGTARPVVNFPPYPFVADYGEGADVVDLDGNRYLDLHNNFASLVLGHAHPAVVEAIRRQAGRSTAFGVPNALEAELAQTIVERVGSVEQVTFTNSGTEASLTALQLARAFTGRPKIAKFEGGYHGFSDQIFLSVRQAADNGEAARPLTVGNSLGTPDALLSGVITLPFNDATAVEQILTERASEIAAVVVEPIQMVGGTITPADDFLTQVQSIARRLGILVVADEVVTLRLSYSGAQEVFGLTPDLTVMGKIIGGGLPVGAVGGRREVLALLDPSQTPLPVWHTGTFSGNPLTMAAGIATLGVLTRGEIDRINALGDRLRYGLSQFCREQGLAVTVNGWGSLINPHFQATPVRVSRDGWAADRAKLAAFFQAMLADGFFIMHRGSFCLSTAMTEEDVERFYEAATRNLERVCRG